ncbi:MAG: thiol-disulfide oxidoreductase DCC family protein [Synechococcaceae cyanobacterium]
MKGSPSASAASSANPSATSSSSAIAPPFATITPLAPAPQPSRPSDSRPQLTVLYDGGCPLCLREVRLLQRRDGQRGRLAFVDIDAADYDPSRWCGIGYRQAMGRIHAIAADGTVLCDLEVFRRAYQLVDLGWLYAPTCWPLLRPLADAVYGFWARQRLRWTGRPDLDQLCRDRQSCGVPASALGSLEVLRP